MGSGLRIVLLALLWLSTGPCGQVRAELLTIGGTGSSTPLVQLLFEAFQRQDPETSLRIIQPPLGSNGALKALATGRVDLAMVGRTLSAEEPGEYGEHFDLADTPFVMASRDGQHQGGFSLDELADVYAGSLLAWDSGAPLRLVVRGNFESDTLQLKSMSSRLAEAVEVAAKRPGMAGAGNDIETASLLARIPGSFGPTTLGLLTTMNLRLVVFPLNGVAPSLANLKNGSYPWFKRLTVVSPRQPSAAAKRFVAFLRSATARDVMQRYDYLPGIP